MARVAGMKERTHSPRFDGIFIRGVRNGTQAQVLGEAITDPRVIRFFVDVQNKTRLETNMEAAGVLPSLNSFEARAMRVVVSSLDEEATRNDDQGNPTIPQVDEARFLADLIYNSVTTLLVGEKTMIEMPTYWFPAGAGVSPGGSMLGNIPIVQNHGEPNHLNSFRFAEPVFIESQQNFRVEIAFPHGIPPAVENAIGPYRIWVVLDGYLTRDVQ